jgi:hypothetical protein
MVTVTANIQTNASNTTDGGAVSFAISGATTRVAADATSFLAEHITGNGSPGLVMQGSGTYFVTGLIPGSNTFTLQYKSIVGGTQTFSNRSITVIPY